MKKQFAIAALALAAFTATAQTTTQVPNRVLIQSGYDVTGFAINNVDSIFFDRINGPIKAEIGFKGYSVEDGKQTLTMSVTRTEDCNSFCIDVLPANTAKAYNDATMDRYFKMKNAQSMSSDFTEGKLTGFNELKGNTKYTVITLGYDKYGVAGESSRADFTTPKQQTVGTPSVTWTVDETTTNSFTLTVTPNEDTKNFYWCMFEKGAAEAQFEQYGPMMGLDNMEEMIKRFSYYSYSGTTTNTWDDLLPNTEYEVYVLPVDVNDAYGEMVVIPVTTAKLGGEGIASMTITSTGEPVYEEGYGYYLPVTYTPNDQTSIHHDILIEKSYYDMSGLTEETLAEAMKSDTNPFNPFDTYWNSVGTQEVPWGCTPGETYYAFSIAKNANNEYGPLAKLEIATKAAAGVAAKKAIKVNGIATRVANKTNTSKTAVVPSFYQTKGVKLEMTK